MLNVHEGTLEIIGSSRPARLVEARVHPATAPFVQPESHDVPGQGELHLPEAPGRARTGPSGKYDFDDLLREIVRTKFATRAVFKNEVRKVWWQCWQRERGIQPVVEEPTAHGRTRSCEGQVQARRRRASRSSNSSTCPAAPSASIAAAGDSPLHVRTIVPIPASTCARSAGVSDAVIGSAICWIRSMGEYPFVLEYTLYRRQPFRMHLMPRVPLQKPRIPTTNSTDRVKVQPSGRGELGTSRHQRWSAEVLARAGYRCEDCGATGKLVADHVTGRTSRTMSATAARGASAVTV
jgi:hypothetical protein